MATSFPALRGRMGETEFFASVLTLGEVAKMIDFVEAVDDWDKDTDPEAKSQRKLNAARVDREMVPYLVDTPDHFYSALTVEVRPPMDESGRDIITFLPSGSAFPGGIEFGTVTLDGAEILYALDGQHRLKSIQRAIRVSPALAREQIAVILVPFRSLKQSQLLFSDLNRYAKAPSKSTNLLFSHRDPVVRLAKQLVAETEFLSGRLELESTSLSKHTPNVMTLSTLYEMTKTLLGSRSVTNDDEIAVELPRLAAIFETLVCSVPQWRVVADREEHPAYLRSQFLSMHGVGQQGIAIAAARVLAAKGDDVAALTPLGEIDWTTASHEWQGVAVQGRRVNNTTTTVRNLGSLVAFRLGCELSADEAKALTEIYEARGDQIPSGLRRDGKTQRSLL